MTAIIAAASFGSPPSSASVSLSDQSLFRASFGSSATATYTINSSGNVVGTPGGTLEAWLRGTGASSSNYEVIATQSSGTAASGTLGSWLNCGSSNSWSVTNGMQDNSVLTAVITIQIRDVATHTVQASASITLSAESDSRSGGGGGGIQP